MDIQGENSLAIFAGQGVTNNDLVQEEYGSFQSSLWQLLAERTQRYTMGESSSVTVETAQELLESIQYCINLYLKSSGAEQSQKELKSADYSQLFSRGMEELKTHMEIGRQLCEQAEASMLQIENQSYQSVISDIQGFFKKYDFYYFAHQTPCMIGYSLCCDVSGLQGIAFINEYLRRFIIENYFCSYFKAETINALLRSYHFDCESQFENVYELVAVNAIGLSLLNGNVLAIDITDDDCAKLAEQFLLWTEQEASDKLAAAVKHLGRLFDMQNDHELEYLQSTATVLHSRLKSLTSVESFKNIFLSLQRQNVERFPATKYVDGDKMGDDALRELIEQIGGLTIRERVELIKQKIHSVRDLIEVLSVCFWNEESTMLFDTFGDMELAILLHNVYERQGTNPGWRSASNWEDNLVRYIRGLDNQRMTEIHKIIDRL